MPTTSRIVLPLKKAATSSCCAAAGKPAARTMDRASRVFFIRSVLPVVSPRLARQSIISPKDRYIRTRVWFARFMMRKPAHGTGWCGGTSRRRAFLVGRERQLHRLLAPRRQIERLGQHQAVMRLGGG